MSSSATGLPRGSVSGDESSADSTPDTPRTVAPSGPNDRVPQLRIIHEEIDAQLASYDRRLQAMDTRAGVLVAAAALAATLVSGWDGNGWLSAAIATALIGAVLGVAALYPGKASTLSGASIREKVYGRGEGEALLWLIDQKNAMWAAKENRIVVKARLIQIGFAVFAGSIVFMFLSTTPVRFTIGLD